MCWGARCASPSTCRPQALTGQKVPVLYWLSGLTCTDENFMQKAGAQRIAAELGIALVAPDQPRGEGVADDPGYDLGMGRVSTSTPPRPLAGSLPDVRLRHPGSCPSSSRPTSRSRRSAPSAATPWEATAPLIAALREPGRYRSVSAFSPISHPSRCPGARRPSAPTSATTPCCGREWDACQLLRHHDSPPLPTPGGRGAGRPFLAEQLGIDTLAEVAATRAWPPTLNRHAGYDHSYYFVASFIEAHLRFHASHLGEPAWG